MVGQSTLQLQVDNRKTYGRRARFHPSLADSDAGACRQVPRALLFQWRNRLPACMLGTFFIYSTLKDVMKKVPEP